MITLNRITDETESTCSSDVVSQIITKIHGSPELAPLVFGLYAGPSYPSPSPNYPPPTKSRTAPRDILTPELDLDTRRIEYIHTLNSFSPKNIAPITDPHIVTQKSQHPKTWTLGSRAESKIPQLDKSDIAASAFHLLPSLFNHSCCGNVTSSHFRNIMVIRAAKDVEEGEELTLPYVHGYSYLSRRERLKKYGITCDCSLCEADRADGEVACRRRDALLSPLDAPGLRDADVDQIRPFLCAVEGTHAPSRGPIRPASGRARLDLAVANELLARRDSNTSFWIQAALTSMAALEAYGIVVGDKSTWGPGVLTEDPAQEDEYLPIGMKSSDPVTDIEGVDRFIQICLMISGDFGALNDSTREKRWLRAAMARKLPNIALHQYQLDAETFLP